MAGWLKAGLIGIGVLVVLSLIGLVQILNCITLPLTVVTYVVVGVLAASYMTPRREAGAAAGQGALAALVASFGGGLVAFVINLLRAATGRAYEVTDLLRLLPPEILLQLRDLGISPNLVSGVGGVGFAAVCGSACCLTGIVFAVILGAIGGAIYAAVKPD